LESFIPLVYGKEELGLARIENLINKLGNPQKSFKSVLVGGTAGKGSTAFYVSRLLEEYGLKVGLHISPHLIYIGERMQIFQSQISNLKSQRLKGNAIPVKRLVGLVNEIKPVIDDIKSKQPELLPSYFEILVALSFLYFAKEKVDWAVVEVGLGGRLDATNILVPEISVITNVGLDHTEILGDTIEKIALEKAGIIKIRNKKQETRNKESYGVPVVTGARGKALKVIEKEAKTRGSELINIYTQGFGNVGKLDLFRSVFKPKDLNSHIPYYVNSECALLALLVVLELKMPLSKETIKNAFSQKFIGRFEEIDNGIIVDGAHNPDKIRALLEFLRRSNVKSKMSKVVLVIAFKKGKNWQEMIDLLVKNLSVKKIIATQYFAVTDTGKGSAVEADEIAKYLRIKKYELRIKVRKNSQEAVFEAVKEINKKQKEKSIVLVTGSLYLVGEASTLWKLPDF